MCAHVTVPGMDAVKPVAEKASPTKAVIAARRRHSFLSMDEDVPSPIDRTNAKDRELLCSAVIHTADLNNPSLEFDMAKQWAHRVVEEFYDQHLKEEAQGIPSSQAMMKPPTDVLAMAELQQGFIEFVVTPLWHIMAVYFPELTERTLTLTINKAKWKAIADEEHSKKTQ
jgi:hypothetical protein